MNNKIVTLTLSFCLRALVTQAENNFYVVTDHAGFRTGPSPASISIYRNVGYFDDGSGSASGAANANYGSVGAAARAHYFIADARYLQNYSFGHRSQASLSVSDVVFSGPPTSNGMVQVALRMTATGTIEASAEARNGLAGSGAYVKIAVDATLHGTSFQGERNLSMDAQGSGTFHGPFYQETGLFTGSDGTNIQTGLVDVPLNTPVSLSMGVDVSAVVAWDVTGTVASAPTRLFANAISAYGHTVSFALSGPVFQLPEGYTVNSPGGSIVNNEYYPPLGIARSTNGLVVSWPAGATNLFLQSTTALGPDQSWTRETNIISSGDLNLLNVGGEAGNRFFRLSR